jgi:hypothetical protein
VCRVKYVCSYAQVAAGYGTCSLGVEYVCVVWSVLVVHSLIHTRTHTRTTTLTHTSHTRTHHTHTHIHSQDWEKGKRDVPEMKPVVP